MILTVDIGNTNITIGGYDNDTLAFTARMATERSHTSDQYAVLLDAVLRLKGVELERITGAAISSVVPSVAAAFSEALTMLCGVRAVCIGPGVKTGLNIRIDNPAQLGADLVAGCVGALAKYPLPCIVFDLGTATTAAVLDRNGCMIGGAIAAGLNTTRNALSSQTAQLPLVDLAAPAAVIGTNTVDCIQSGLIFGAAAMLDGMAERMEEELGEPATLVATGGLGARVTAHCKREFLLDENLLLDGLLLIYKRNQR